jgi:3-hydroxyacyl-CoA dehydrogenase
MLASEQKLLHYKRRELLIYNIPTKSQTKIPGQDSFIILNNIRESKKVWSNSGGIITDLGDGIELRVPIKMNTIGGDVLQAIN